MSKGITEKVVKRAIFSFCSLEAKPLVVHMSNLRTRSKGTLKELSNAFLRGAVALQVSELCASLSKNVEIDQI